MQSIIVSRLAICLLVLALGLKAMVPAGFMPDVDALSRGMIRIMICSSGGSTPMIMKHGTDHGAHHSEQVSIAQHKTDHSNHKSNDSPMDQSFCSFGSIAPLLFGLAVFIVAASLIRNRPCFFVLKSQYFQTIINRAARSRAPPALLTV